MTSNVIHIHDLNDERIDIYSNAKASIYFTIEIQSIDASCCSRIRVRNYALFFGFKEFSTVMYFNGIFTWIFNRIQE